MQSVQMENVAYVQVRRGKAPVTYALGLAFRPSNDNPALGAFVGMAHRMYGPRRARTPSAAARRGTR
jgi:hypothetical protein